MVKKVKKNKQFRPKKLLVFGLIIGLIQSCASGPEAAFNRTYTYFERGEFELAIKESKELIKSKFDLANTAYLIAESYRLSNRIDQSIPFYEMAIKSGNQEPMILYHLAYAHKFLGEYDSEKKYLTEFLSKSPTRDYQIRTEIELENLNKIPELTIKENSVKIYGLDGNTENAEFSPQIYENKLIISSSKKSQIYKNNGQPFVGLYQVNLEGPTKIVSTDLYSNSIFKENANEGTPAFSKDGQFVLFARGNTGTKGDKDVNVDLYLSRKIGNGWSNPEKLGINDSLAWDGSPCFSSDGRTLYFSSDRRGGKGGLDLYRVSMDNSGRFGRPVNMGSQINTPGDEVFPYISEDGKLYFSSNGHPNLGGLDLFVATRNGNEIVIEHLGMPINSTADDFGIVEIDGNHGYFSSNRTGGKGDDDIYYYIGGENTDRWWTNDPIPEPEKIDKTVNYYIIAEIKDSRNKPLNGVNYRIKKNGEKFLEDKSNETGNTTKLKLEDSDELAFLFEKENYLTKRADFSMIGNTIPLQLLKKEVTDTTFHLNIIMEELEIGKEITRTLNVNSIYYDLDKSDIRADAALELDKIVEFLNDNPQIQLELGSHTDSRASNSYNLRLSQRRAESAVNYITSNGIDPSRIIAKGYGETQLINECSNGVDCSEEKHQENRRTEFIITDIIN